MKSFFRLGSQRRGFFGARSKKPASSSSTKLYETLGVNQQSSDVEIKKAFKQLALKHHPDRGGDADKFKEIAQAYEVLSDPEKRRVYDAFGQEGLDGSAGSAQYSDPHDIFSQMFGNRGAPRVMRTPDALHRVEVSLEDLFNGVTRSIRYSRDVVCKTCQGQGATRVETCKRCGGSGHVMTRQNIGIMVNMQSQCPDCAGNGFRVPPGCKCSICNGAGKLTEKETFEVKIPKGCDTGSRFVYPGKADELPGHEAGDVIIEVWEKPHAKFTRIGADLYITQKVKLAEALTGVKFIHTHLDGKVVDIASGSSDEVVKPGAVWKVPGLGMGGSGSLFVRFEVDFPDTLRRNEALAKLADELRVESKGSGVHVERTVMAGKRLSDADCLDIVKKLESRMNSKKQQARTSNDADPSSQCQQQ